jgi:predicted  nucleic acid-binding Zn-ribbon protein
MGQPGDSSKKSEDASLKLERLKAWLDFWKFIGASVVAAIVIVAIPPFFQLATAKLESARKAAELDQSKITFHDTYVKDFVEKALNQDIEIRMRLAAYFSDVSDEEYKNDWNQYLTCLKESRDQLRKEINDGERRLSSLQSNRQSDPADVSELKRNLTGNTESWVTQRLIEISSAILGQLSRMFMNQ